jgi:hypothetical protein
LMCSSTIYLHNLRSSNIVIADVKPQHASLHLTKKKKIMQIMTAFVHVYPM